MVAARRSKRGRQIVITKSRSDKGTDTEHTRVKAIRLIYGLQFTVQAQWAARNSQGIVMNFSYHA